QELACTDQSGARRRFRSCGFRASGPVRGTGTPHRNAPAVEKMAANNDPQSGISILSSRGRDHLDRKLAQVLSAGSDPDGRARRLSLRRTMVRFGVAAGTESLLRGLSAKEDEMAKATWKDAVLAESDRTVVVEGNQYFPLDSVRSEYLRPSETHTVCPWKGTASY